MTEPATGREAELLELIVGGDTTPCTLDHHGYCQAHRLEDPCSVAMAVAALFGIEPPKDAEPDHVFEPYDANPGICRHCGAVKPGPCYRIGRSE